MASPSGEGTPGFSIKNGCKIATDQVFTIEDVLLAIGEVVGHEKIVSASRMNKAVVVFLKGENLVNKLVENGIVVSDTLVQVTPLRAPATKVTISNVPPFISDEEIAKELGRFGKFASSIKAVPLGCKNAALKHVLSFRRHVFMFLNAPSKTLEISFRIQHGDSSYMIFATTESMRCFDCGDLGHKRFTCPHKKQTENEVKDGNTEEHVDCSETIENRDKEKRLKITKETMIPSKKQKRQETLVEDIEATVSTCGVLQPSETTQAKSSIEQNASEHSSKSEVSVFNVFNQDGENKGGPNVPTEVVDSVRDREASIGVEDECAGAVQSAVTAEEDSDEAQMEEGDSGAEGSEFDYSQSTTDVYSVEELNNFLDQTKGKKVDVSKYFADGNKFVKSVMFAQKTVGYDVISKQKRFRLKKLMTAVRKAQSDQAKLLKRKK